MGSQVVKQGHGDRWFKENIYIEVKVLHSPKQSTLPPKRFKQAVNEGEVSNSIPIQKEKLISVHVISKYLKYPRDTIILSIILYNTKPTQCYVKNDKK